jgi:hypothetical protein
LQSGSIAGKIGGYPQVVNISSSHPIAAGDP